MSNIKSLYEIYSQKSGSFIENLLKGNVTIDDNINGTYFAAQKREDGWGFYKKNGEISIIDRTLSKFYEKGINHFETISHERRINIPMNLIFVTKYDSKINEPDQIISKQILKLTHIFDTNTNQIINDKQTLDYWADYLVIGNPPIIFNGVLNDEQKSAILNFVYTNQEELARKFKSESFTEYIISILNPEYKSNGIDSVVFRFVDSDSDDVVLAKMIDPLFFDLAKNNEKTINNSTSDIVYIIIIQLMNFIESYSVKDLNQLVDSNMTYEQNYLKVMNKVFLDYISRNYSDFVDIELESPDYIMSDDFDINLSLIDNPDVIELIQMNPNFKEIYKILINFFKKKRKRSNGAFNEDILKLFNVLIDKLQKVIIGKNIFEKYTPSFSEYTGLISEEFNFNYMRSAGIQSKYGMHVRRKPVNIIVDYFQPINNSHIATAETLKNKNKLPSLLVLLSNKDASPLKPFKTEISETILKKVVNDNSSLICGYVVVQTNNIDSILKTLCEQYIPVLWASNKSKIDEYVIQMDYARKRSTKYNVSKKFKLIVSPEMNNTRILDYIATGNYREFCNNTPKSIHSEFYNLKKQFELINK